TVKVAAAAVACMVAWRLPASLGALRDDPGLLALEAASLTVAGLALWTECVASSPFQPRGSRPQRMAVCALCMWANWVMGYLVAMSKGSWYPGYPHPAGGLDARIE